MQPKDADDATGNPTEAKRESLGTQMPEEPTREPRPEPDPKRPVDIQLRGLWLRLAESQKEIEASQALRYQVFCEEMSATPSEEMRASGREFDAFDPYCDHLLMFDTNKPAKGDLAGELPGEVVATYRFMRREQAARKGFFYTSTEYDIAALEDYPGEIMELGRSCVAQDYRRGTVMQMLWAGIAQYVFHYDVALMLGCASLPGTDPDELALQLSYLQSRHLAPPELRAKARPELYVDMARLEAAEIDEKAALAALPPLLKGYLRLGGFVGEGAVVDREFGTTDVCVVVKTDLVTERYYKHYARTGQSPQAEQGQAGERKA